ncbi:MAG: 50S ribosomal protein L25 [Spirochaetes bacterium]|nr:50S ribosomal protein L25 [Spirochaetota bacterium]
MEPKKLNVQLRTDQGKSASGRLRRGGKIPAVVYGHTEPLAITVDAHEFRTAFRRITENTVVQLTMPEGVHEVLVKDYQQNHLSGQIVHLDFYEFEKGKSLKTRVPVQLTGAPVGVKEGGILETLMHDLEVECLPKDLPEVITLDISNLALNHSIHVRDLLLAEGVKALNSLEQVVCVVAIRKAEEEPKPAAEGELVEGELAEGAVAEGEAAEGEAAEGEAAEGAVAKGAVAKGAAAKGEAAKGEAAKGGAAKGGAAKGAAAEGGEKKRKGGRDREK